MPDESASSHHRCPMCGAGLSPDAGYCGECGERFGTRARPDIELERVRSFVEARYERNLHVLEWLLLVCGHLTFIASILIMLAYSPARYSGPMFGIGLIVFFAGSAWIVAGYACARRKRWGILTGLVVSYLMLGGSLLYWILTGIAVSLILSIQAHRVLRFSHQVLARRLDSQEELSS